MVLPYMDNKDPGILKQYEKCVEAPRQMTMQMTIEEELDSLTRMLDEYQMLTENIEQTKRRLQERFDISSTRLSKLFEHQELIKRGEYPVRDEEPTRGRF